MKNAIISAAISFFVALVVAGGYIALHPAAPATVSTGYGATVGTTHIESLNISKGPFSLSFPNATTTGTTVTLQQSDIQPYNSLLATPSGAATYTLPASTTLSLLAPKVGDVFQLIVVNNSASNAITIAGGTGTLLKKASTTAAIAAGSVGELEFVRKSNTDLDVFFDTGI